MPNNEVTLENKNGVNSITLRHGLEKDTEFSVKADEEGYLHLGVVHKLDPITILSLERDNEGNTTVRLSKKF